MNNQTLADKLADYLVETTDIGELIDAYREAKVDQFNEMSLGEQIEYMIDNSIALTDLK